MQPAAGMGLLQNRTLNIQVKEIVRENRRIGSSHALSQYAGFLPLQSLPHEASELTFSLCVHSPICLTDLQFWYLWHKLIQLLSGCQPQHDP